MAGATDSLSPGWPACTPLDSLREVRNSIHIYAHVDIYVSDVTYISEYMGGLWRRC